MRTWKFVLPYWLIFSAFNMTVWAEEPPAEEAELGGKRLKVPAPEGYVRIDGIDSRFDAFPERLVSKNNKLLAFYGSDADLKKVRAGEIPDIDRNFNIQAIVPQMDFTPKLFGEFTDYAENESKKGLESLEEDIEELAKEVNELVSEITEADVALRLGKTVPLGGFIKGEGWMSFAMRIPMEVEGGGKRSKLVATSVTYMFLVDSKIIALNGTFMNSEDAALEELHAELKPWRLAFLEANK